jgi:FkbM family methyltransferase
MFNLKFILNFFPKSQYLRFLYLYLYFSNSLDPNLKYIKNFCLKRRRAIDIGVNVGIYSYFLSKHFDLVESFEPHLFITEKLKCYNSLKNNINIYNVALSDISGNTNFYVPYINDSSVLNYGLSSLNDPGGVRDVFNVDLKTLDFYEFKNVDFIKIDVEGAEYQVLKGSIKTIESCKPIILIEIEQRHLKNNLIEEIFEFIISLGYQGFFINNGQLVNIDKFNYEIHQKPFLKDVYSRSYVNNFWFKPK